MSADAPPPGDDATDAFDVAAALDFLQRSRSKFVRDAAVWLSAFDDNADILFALAGAVGQNMGPWETFRTCAVFGLGASNAVQALAEDVLSEVPPPGRAPCLAAAFAWAHAAELRPDLAHQADRELFVTTLEHSEPASDAETFGRDCALYALGIQGARPGDDVVAAKENAAVVSLALEAALGRGDDALAAAALSSLGAHQDSDGAVACEAAHPVFKAMATSRAVALVARHHQFGVAPLSIAPRSR